MVKVKTTFSDFIFIYTVDKIHKYDHVYQNLEENK